MVIKLALKSSPSWTGVLDHTLSGVEMITELCSLPQFLKSPLGPRVPPLEPQRQRLLPDRHGSGFYKCLFQNKRVPSGLSSGGYCVPVGACQLMEVLETGLKFLYLSFSRPPKLTNNFSNHVRKWSLRSPDDCRYN